MTGYVEKTIRGKKAVCKTITSRSRNGLEYKREMCFELKEDGSRGRLISSRRVGKPHHTIKQLREIEAGRNPKSRGRDEIQNATTILSPTDPRVDTWARSPSYRRRVDVEGVDTIGATVPAKTKTKKKSAKKTATAKKTPAKTTNKEKITCKIHTTPRGNKYEICRDKKTGQIVSRRVVSVKA